ncbi:hypothetical protein [Thermococcus eurythermalis]|nr:hypothetical protein [Thermococcus eurythermalis]
MAVDAPLIRMKKRTVAILRVRERGADASRPTRIPKAFPFTTMKLTSSPP